MGKITVRALCAIWSDGAMVPSGKTLDLDVAEVERLEGLAAGMGRRIVERVAAPDTAAPVAEPAPAPVPVKPPAPASGGKKQKRPAIVPGAEGSPL